MTIDELISQAKAAAGKPLSDLPDAKAKILVRRVFAEVVRSIEAGDSEPVRVNGLGIFRTRTVRDQKLGADVKRVIFRPAVAPVKK